MIQNWEADFISDPTQLKSEINICTGHYSSKSKVDL